MSNKLLAALFAAGLCCSPAFAQSESGASVSVQAGPLRGEANAGQAANPADTGQTAQNRAPSRQRALPTDQRCDRVTVRSGDGSSSASASASVSASGGNTALAAGGSPNARTEFSDCTETHPDTRAASSGRGGPYENRP
jgi:hypothetical protein